MMLICSFVLNMLQNWKRSKYAFIFPIKSFPFSSECLESSLNQSENQDNPIAKNMTCHRNPPLNDDSDGQMIFGDLGDLKLPDISLTGKKKNPHPGNLSRPGIEPWPAEWTEAYGISLWLMRPGLDLAN